MAKKALLDVLEQTIGKYVKNLDAESLNVAVWSGKIELHSLELDVAAVNAELDRQAAETPNLALPLQVLSGKFESFEVDVPWASLTSRSVVLRARGLHVNVQPYDRLAATDPLHASAESEEARSIKIRQTRAKSIELSEKYRQQAYAVRKLAADTTISEKGGNQQQQTSSFGSRLVRRIIENIQIEISDVHVCLTDSDGKAGVVLEKLSLVTTDNQAKQVFVDRTKDGADAFLHKALLLRGFGVYLDHEDFKTEKFVTAKTTLGAIQEDSAVKKGSPNKGAQTLFPAPVLDHSYVLAPLSLQAKLRQADGQVCVDYAKYQLSTELSSLSILLSRQQLELARRISSVVSSSKGATARPIFPEYRPLTRVTSGAAAKEWWKYAVRCIGRLNSRRCWVEFFYAYKKRKAYIPLYKRQAHYQTCSWYKALTSTEMEELIHIEQDRTISVEGLMSWRTIADGQVDKEREKKQAKLEEKKKNEKSSYFSSIFGSTATTAAEESLESGNEPPIHLSLDELKELESISKEQFDEPELSIDSKLYDANFVLKSLKVNLISYDLRHLAALEMGTVAVDFKAAADGAFSFNFDLADLEIQDRVTTNSLFPSVLKSIDPSKKNAAFHLHVSKTKSGDQSLKLQLAAFEAVTSQMLFKELKRFAAGTSTGSGSKVKKQNPILAQSLSGSVDLFYDTDQGTSTQLLQPAIAKEGELDLRSPRGVGMVDHKKQAATTNDLSNVLVDAWKEKTANRAAWMVDVDIKAPVVLIPQKCHDPTSTVLIVDLGRFRLTYGQVAPSTKVATWFNDYPRIVEEVSELSLDSGTLAISDLTFKVGKAVDWRLLLGGDTNSETSVIDPISLSLDIGVESLSHSADPPRICCIGVIPTISLRMSPTQGAKIFSVLGSWTRLLAEMDDENPDLGQIDVLPVTDDRLYDLTVENDGDSADESILANRGSGEQPQFFFVIGLQRLSVTVSLDAQSRLEAHLVSVYASMQLMVDGTIAIGLRMGWFWILDLVESSHPRHQRLLAHSNLPREAEFFAHDRKYDILDVLTRQGVFDPHYSGSTELADVSFRKISTAAINEAKRRGEEFIENTVDANFSSLFIHWNPHGAKGVSNLLEKLALVAEDFDDSGSLVVSPEKDSRSRHSILPSDPNEAVPKLGQTKISARMRRLDLNLNSALDDLPLFVLTVSETQVSILSGDALDASIKLGDIRVRTPDSMGSTLTMYRTLLGLAPNRTENLLTVRYVQGHGLIKQLELSADNDANLQAFAEVDLSPMRLCFIQSQVMALVEYFSEGILGALTAKAATSAAQKAIEIADLVVGTKLFRIRATAFDLVLPQAAHNEQAFHVHARALDVHYSMLPSSGGSEAKVELSEVDIRGPGGATMQEKPVRMSLYVVLPSDEVGTLDDKALRVAIHMTDANFFVSRSQYLQVLRTLDENTGQLELFLRDDNIISSPRSESFQSGFSRDGASTLTHAGNVFLEKQRRMYLKVSLDSMSLQLLDSSQQPIIRFAAINAGIGYDSFPDTLSKSSTVILHSLVCEDMRDWAAQRQYRFLIRQEHTGDVDEGLFSIGYSSAVNETTLDLKVGSPQVVLIPDAIAEVLAFVQEGDKEVVGTTRSYAQAETSLPSSSAQTEKLVFHSASGSDEAEATLVDHVDIFRTRLTATTKTCQIVLVDLGSQLVKHPSSQTQLTETLVLQGKFSAAWTATSDLSTGILIESEYNGQAEAMEIFSAFGKEMRSPLQILEPAEGSAHGSTKTSSDGGMEIEIRAAALTTFDFTVSMHNAALLSAIVNSLKASFMSANGDSIDDVVDLDELSKADQEHIETLASALDKGSERNPMGYHASSSSVGEPSAAASTKTTAESTSGSRMQIKLTMPETKVTVINDLQGLDEALFRASVTNFVAGADVVRYSSPDMTFDFHMNTSILADYFDTSCSIWNSLLVKPWETTLKGFRSHNQRFKSDRLSTTIDLESFPCCISFSEQFLVSLASASRMWSIYSVATDVHTEERLNTKSGSMRASMAATAARNLVMSMPYAVENASGIDVSFALLGGGEMKHICRTGSIQYFRFEPPKGVGYGGRRRYGQDVNFVKVVTLFLEGETEISIDGLDLGHGSHKTAHTLSNGTVLMTRVAKEGKTTVLRLTSCVDVVNNTTLPFRVALEQGTKQRPMGTCMSYNLTRGSDTPLAIAESGIASKESRFFSVPVDSLVPFHASWEQHKQGTLNFSISPTLPEDQNAALRGVICVSVTYDQLRRSGDGRVISKFDVLCSLEEKEQTRSISPLVVQVILSIELTPEGTPQINIRLEPRALVENRFPIPIALRTPMPHTFSSSPDVEILGNDVIYKLQTGQRIEIFTPGPSIAVTIKTGESSMAGSDLDWLEGGWIDLPLISEFSLVEPVRCSLPFAKDVFDVFDNSGATGSEFFIAEQAQSLADLAAPAEGAKKVPSMPKSDTRIAASSPDAPLRTFYVTVCYYGVDHTGHVLFEQVHRSDPIFKATLSDSGRELSPSSSSQRSGSTRQSGRSFSAVKMTPFGAFGSNQSNRRITLLPSGNVPLRILQMTMEEDVGFRRSLPFFVEELPIGDGGIDTLPIMWETGMTSGYYAFRTILNEHQSEVHVIPEFQVFNGSQKLVLVHERGRPEVIIEGGKVSSLDVGTRLSGLEIALYFIELECRTSFFRVDKLGLKVVILKSNTGIAVGSLCIQTVIDTHGDSRLVVKIGEISKGTSGSDTDMKQTSLFRNDFFRFRVRWTELQLILNELQKPDTKWNVIKGALSRWHTAQTSPGAGIVGSQEPSPKKISVSPAREALQHPRFHFTPLQKSPKIAEILQQPVASIIFSRFTFDFQRVFKDHDTKDQSGLYKSPERSQISLIIHNVVVKDLTPDTPFPMVFDCSSQACSFFDACIRVRGPLDAEIVKVDLFDLNLAHAQGVTERIKLTTSEEYVWRIIDLVNRILAASGDFAGYTLKLEEDKEHGGFIVRIEDNKTTGTVTSHSKYSPPRSDTLYDIDLARVSPFSLLVSFKRNPEVSRYKKIGSNVRGSAMMNYFTRKLKFTIDRAELNFARYEDRSLKGPPDRLLENLSAVYMSRMKFKLVTLLTAASLQDWKYLAARADGDDEFVEGDILRAAGNLTGKASHLIFKKAGQKIGAGVSDLTRAFGNSIERTTDKIGVGRVGAGVNSVVTGVGDGVGSTISGVGNGTGKILKGAGQGIGHAIGGISGGAMQIGKGIGKGITKGDGRAVVDGFQQGLVSAGTGLASGAETAVVGAADGIISVGRGLFSGVKNVGKGLGGAFAGKKPARKPPR